MVLNSLSLFLVRVTRPSQPVEPRRLSSIAIEVVMWIQDQADFIGGDIDSERLQRCGASTMCTCLSSCRHQCFGWSVWLWVLGRLCMAFLTCFLVSLL